MSAAVDQTRLYGLFNRPLVALAAGQHGVFAIWQARGLGLTEKELAEVNGADRRWVMFDYALGLLRSLSVQNDPVKAAAFKKRARIGGPPMAVETGRAILTRRGAAEGFLVDLTP